LAGAAAGAPPALSVRERSRKTAVTMTHRAADEKHLSADKRQVRWADLRNTHPLTR
jgi:hypothetical protein